VVVAALICARYLPGRAQVAETADEADGLAELEFASAD
jgi:hypothetical protein